MVQVSLALVLLICSGLMIRTFRALTQVDPGFLQTRRVQTFRISIPETQVPDREPVVRMDEAILENRSDSRRLSVAWSQASRWTATPTTILSSSQDRTYAEGELPPVRRFKCISPGFLETLGTPLIAGRDFTWADTYQTSSCCRCLRKFRARVLARSCRRSGQTHSRRTIDDWREIIGVVGDVHDNGVSQPAPTTFSGPS